MMFRVRMDDQRKFWYFLVWPDLFHKTRSERERKREGEWSCVIFTKPSLEWEETQRSGCFLDW